jgi:hypothetical protein
MELSYASHGLAAVPRRLHLRDPGRRRRFAKKCVQRRPPRQRPRPLPAGTRPRRTEADALAAGRRDRGAARRVAVAGRARSSRPSTTVPCSETAAPRRSAAWPRRSLDRASLFTCSPHRRRRCSNGWLDLAAARCIHVPHPNYDSALGQPGDRAAARRRLDVAQDGHARGPGRPDRLAVRPEGWTRAHRSVPRLSRPLPEWAHRRLLLAGSLAANGEALIRASCDDAGSSRASATCRTRSFLAPRRARRRGRSYGQYLNSGWLNLALTAGVPAIARRAARTAEVVRAEALRSFDPQPRTHSRGPRRRSEPRDSPRRAPRPGHRSPISTPRPISARFVEASSTRRRYCSDMTIGNARDRPCRRPRPTRPASIIVHARRPRSGPEGSC